MFDEGEEVMERREAAERTEVGNVPSNERASNSKKRESESERERERATLGDVWKKD